MVSYPNRPVPVSRYLPIVDKTEEAKGYIFTNNHNYT